MPNSENKTEQTVSVIVPSYNSRKTIEKCLNALMALQGAAPHEIIFVDSSDDGTTEFVRKQFPQLKVIHFEEKTIPSKARNAGIEKANGDILAFTDSDCIVDSNWLVEIKKALNTDYDVVGGSTINAYPFNPISVAEYYLEFRELSVHSPRREKIGLLASNNLAIRKHIFDKFGTFPDIRASEDTLFIYNLRKNSVKTVFEPKVKIRHMNRRHLVPFLKNQQVLGFNSAIARRLVPLEGAGLAKSVYIAPFLPLVKVFRTFQFILKNRFPHNFHHLLQFVFSLPFFMIGACTWSLGFAKGIREPLTDRDELREYVGLESA